MIEYGDADIMVAGEVLNQPFRHWALVVSVAARAFVSLRNDDPKTASRPVGQGS